MIYRGRQTVQNIGGSLYLFSFLPSNPPGLASAPSSSKVIRCALLVGIARFRSNGPTLPQAVYRRDEPKPEPVQSGARYLFSSLLFHPIDRASTPLQRSQSRTLLGAHGFFCPSPPSLHVLTVLLSTGRVQALRIQTRTRTVRCVLPLLFSSFQSTRPGQRAISSKVIRCALLVGIARFRSNCPTLHRPYTGTTNPNPKSYSQVRVTSCLFFLPIDRAWPARPLTCPRLAPRLPPRPRRPTRMGYFTFSLSPSCSQTWLRVPTGSTKSR